MNEDFLQTRVYMTRNKKKWCIVKLYRKKRKMQEAYKEFRPKDRNHFRTLGVHCGYSIKKVLKNGRYGRTSGETGTIMLSSENCGAGIATHEILHGILWAHKHTFNKEQYPLVIHNMKHEESILQDFTYAVTQFYQWYWKIENKLK